MKIATILPYKENYSKNGAGAVALWVSEFIRDSVNKNSTYIFGSTQNKKFLSKNYININLNKFNSKFNSTTKKYSQEILKKVQDHNFDIIEIHNRPNMVMDFSNKVNSKIILYFHNDPTSMKGAKTIEERLDLLDKVDKIIFISDWVKKKFFTNLPRISQNKTDIIYHSIDPTEKRIKKNKQIIFVGKLNDSKGYDLFCKAMFKVLDRFTDWKAISIGEEKRFQDFPRHIHHLNLGQLSHNKVIKYLEKSEIAIIPSRWEEPFGRTALEAASRGCATIISGTGGLSETTDHAIKLKILDVYNIEKEVIKLIKNNNLRKKIQIKSKTNIKNKIKYNSIKIDRMRNSLFPFLNLRFNKNKLRILNIYNLAQKLNHRIYNLSLGKKFTNGFIRNGHDVIEISDRDYLKNNKSFSLIPDGNKFQNYIIETFKNYNPDLLFFGHTKNLKLETLDELKSINKNLIISQWNEDPVMPSLKYSKKNIHNINIYADFVDHNFI